MNKMRNLTDKNHEKESKRNCRAKEDNELHWKNKKIKQSINKSKRRKNLWDRRQELWNYSVRGKQRKKNEESE